MWYERTLPSASVSSMSQAVMVIARPAGVPLVYPQRCFYRSGQEGDVELDRGGALVAVHVDVTGGLQEPLSGRVALGGAAWVSPW